MSVRAIKILKLFNEKADRLDQLSFTKFVRENTIGFSMAHKEGEHFSFEVCGPSAEATDAFILTLRFFVQDNEAISIRNLGILYETLPVSQRLRDQYRDARITVNGFLDASSKVHLRGEDLTNRRVFGVFLYGGLAHASMTKKGEFDSWARDPILFGLLQITFHGVITELLRFILWSHEHNLLAIRELETVTPRA